MADWKGQSKGSVLGYKIFIFFIKYFGLRATYGLLYFVAFYYFFSSYSTSKNIYTYYHNRLRFSKIKSLTGIFNSYVQLGKSLIDRVAVTVGFKNKFSFEFDGVQHIKSLVKEGKGGIIFTAHIGNFNISKSFFTEVSKEPIQVNMVVTDTEHKQIKNYLNSVTGETQLKLIVVKEDMSHIFKINDALQNNELLVFASDRSGEGKHLKADFLGKETQFFQGPFKLAAQKKLPILFAYIMREKNFHYHFYARRFEPSKYAAQDILMGYTAYLEKMVRKYPAQWFNFYDFWKEN
ncbi:lysophospholipid acyltransferase family protein [Mesonia ostreae]|uniref:Lysophospholipid acyltransferase family protein n=1 Tax=Mesonia ostreae TaxID=861110 RepID=A0ABU2KI52_9FLAO|nr:lysophospholipid acyltransferase family protein [Mesonia ostreae]MDT0294385.1 lysophospholipid acyltransferase family protein [Mesonia ostreae]